MKRGTKHFVSTPILCCADSLFACTPTSPVRSTAGRVWTTPTGKAPNTHKSTVSSHVRELTKHQSDHLRGQTTPYQQICESIQSIVGLSPADVVHICRWNACPFCHQNTGIKSPTNGQQSEKKEGNYQSTKGTSHVRHQLGTRGYIYSMSENLYPLFFYCVNKRRLILKKNANC